MDVELQMETGKFVGMFSTLKKNYRWSIGDLTLRFIALVYSIAGMEFDKDVFDRMVKFIKQNTKVMSYYRGHQMYSAAALMITRFDDPQAAFMSLLQYEERMREGGFKRSNYLSIASYSLLVTCKPEDTDSRILKAMELYEGMKKNHFWLTGTDDYAIAVLMAESGDKSEYLISDTEECYDQLHRQGFYKGNGLQFLSHLLAFMSGTPQERAQMAAEVNERLRNEGLKISMAYYGTLGYISILQAIDGKAVDAVIETAGYLRADKNFRWAGKDMNIMAAAAITSRKYMDRLRAGGGLLEAGLSISIEAMIAAQTAAIIAASSAATAAAAASSSS
ncbi:MAG: DUF4003 domain-containing protein [Clostridiales bacterium]|nr:DUF4003 domain-containing protein [Clostridiales bacterium]